MFAFVIAVVVGVALGVFAAIFQNTWLDYFAVGISIGAQVLPNFVLAPILVLIFTLWLGWLPGGGWEGGQWQYLVMPVIAHGDGLHGVDRADHPVVDAGGADLEPHPHRAGQGPADMEGDHCATR